MATMFENFWKGHLLIFEHPLAPKYDTVTGWRLLAAFVMLGLLAIPAMQYGLRATFVGGQIWSHLAFVCLALSLFFLVIRWYLKVEPSDVGLRAWSHWTAREKGYFFQTALMAIVLFSLIFEQHLLQLINQYGLMDFLIFSALTGLLWGLLQEFIYRGLLQTELVRRYGAVAGLLMANIVFTFGPLHANYFHFGSAMPPQWGMFAMIFGIGLVFGVLYQRTGNLWIPAVFHGLWPLNMT